MNDSNAQWTQHRAFLFSHPRTASNLLIRLLSTQSEWEISDYNFFDAFQYTRDAFNGVTSASELPKHVRAEHSHLVEEGHKQLQRFLQDSAQKRKHALIKDHALLVSPVDTAYWGTDENALSAPNASKTQAAIQSPRSNPTIFSDSEMHSWTPIILIRNPFAVYESWLRAEGKPYPDLESRYSKIYTTMAFQRRIFDWYLQCSKDGRSTTAPIVLDADDVIEDREVIRKLCRALGMDEAELSFEWEAESTSSGLGNVNERYQRFLKTIHCSTGVDHSKVCKDMEVSAKEREWTEEFGSDATTTLLRRVQESWPDYEYLKSFKLS